MMKKISKFLNKDRIGILKSIKHSLKLSLGRQKSPRVAILSVTNEIHKEVEF